MAINVKVTREAGENTASVLRKFSFKVRSSGILLKARKEMYRQKPISRNMRKRNAVVRLKKLAEIQKLIKEGRLKEKVKKHVPTSVSGK